MKFPKSLLSLLCFFATVNVLSAQEGTAADSLYRPTGFYLYSDQDFFRDKYNEDRNYTMGLTLGLFGPVADRNYLGVPWLRKKIDRFTGVEKHHCANQLFSFPGFQVFVSAFTPLAIDSVQPIVGDRPYASLLCLSSSKVSVNRLKGWAVLSEFNLGMLGLQIARDFQTTVHENHWLGSTRPTPRGWHNQISNGGEPTLMYRLGYRKRLLEQPWKSEKWPLMKRFQLVGTAEGMFGYYTNAAVGMEAKIGFFSNNFWEMASGTSLGGNQGVQGDPKPKLPLAELYFFAALRQRAVAYNALLQGQFRHTDYHLDASDLERLIGEYELGVGARIWKINLQWGIISGRSPEYRGDFARPHIWGNILIRATWNIRAKYEERDCTALNG